MIKIKNSSELYDDLCNRLEPYVSEALESLSYKRSEVEVLTKNQKKSLFKEAKTTKDKKFIEELSKLSKVIPDENILKNVRLNIATQVIASSWSETLRYVSKSYEKVKLRDCLLPDNLGKSQHALDTNMKQIGFSQNNIEDLLRNFGQKELNNGLSLPWGGYLVKIQDIFELYMSKP